MGPTEQKSTREGRERLPAVVAWGAWALLSAGLVGYVCVVNADVPISDDWQLVPVYTGHEAVTLSWLWAPLNEHRLPLIKLMLLLGGAATGHDYRTGQLLSALTLSALAAFMIVTAGRLRGGLKISDVFLPMALLHWGQSETLLIGFAINLAVSTALLGSALLIVVRVRGVPSPSQGFLFGGLLLALPLCGMNGVAMVPPLALWLIVAAVVVWRSGDPIGRRVATVWAALSVAALALSAVCVLSMPAARGGAAPPTAEQVARTAAQFFAEGLGPIAEPTWPLSGVALAALAAVTLFRLRQEARAGPNEWLRVLGLLAVGAALVALALAVGWGRGLIGPKAGLMTRYATMAVPALCLAYFVARTAPRRALAVALAALMVGLFAYNTYHGIDRAGPRRARMRALAADVAEGQTPAELGKKWADLYNPQAEATVTRYFEMMRDAHQGPFRG
ncbi:MAG TPA: hypothetical protein VFW33_09150 [Gemmataceae bacterium]|nr:hypothetical protein [Gemmataceae bacterium]